MADETKATEETTAEETAPAGDANRAKVAADTPESKPQGETEKPGETFTKADIERIVQARLQADRADAEKKAEKARKEAVAAALREQGDLSKLAEMRQAEAEEASRRVAEIEPELAARTAERDRYRDVLSAHLEAQRKGLPKHLIDLLDRLDVADQLEYLARNADAVKAPAPEPRPNGSTPSRRSGTTAIGEATPQLPPTPFPLVRGF